MAWICVSYVNPAADCGKGHPTKKAAVASDACFKRFGGVTRLFIQSDGPGVTVGFQSEKKCRVCGDESSRNPKITRRSVGGDTAVECESIGACDKRAGKGR
jgi:hypothetical protein